MQYTEQLHYFVEIVRAGSFSRAAKRFGIATSTLTKSLTNLETSLDKILVKRLKSGVELTSVGKELYESIIDSYRTIEGAVERIKGEDQVAKREIKIITTTGIISYWIIPKLGTFLEDNPEVHIKIETVNASISLTHTDADIAILPSVNDSGMVTKQKLTSFSFELMASPKYIQKYGHPKNFEDLKNHKLIGFYHSKDPYDNSVDWHLKSDGKVIEPRLTMNSAMGVYHATVLGYGISAIGKNLPFDNELVPVLKDQSTPSIDLYIFTPKKRVGEKLIRNLCTALCASNSSAKDFGSL